MGFAFTRIAKNKTPAFFGNLSPAPKKGDKPVSPVISLKSDISKIPSKSLEARITLENKVAARSAGHLSENPKTLGKIAGFFKSK